MGNEFQKVFGQTDQRLNRWTSGQEIVAEPPGEKDAASDTTQEQSARLRQLLEQHRGERHVIVVHAFPDPDAISSAFAHRLISAQYGIAADILYTGVISHRQNVALVNLLDISLTQFDPTIDINVYDAAIFVDNQATTSTEISEALRLANVPVLAVVDHHEMQQDLNPTFVDLRRIGSTATIYAQYLQQGLVAMDKSQQDHVRHRKFCSCWA